VDARAPFPRRGEKATLSPPSRSRTSSRRPGNSSQQRCPRRWRPVLPFHAHGARRAGICRRGVLGVLLPARERLGPAPGPRPGGHRKGRRGPPRDVCRDIPGRGSSSAPGCLDRRACSALSVLPLLTAAGFLAFAQSPSLAVLALAQGLRRAAHFGIERPGREALLTALDRDQNYAPKAFIDSVVYRGGDALAAWLSQALPASALAPAALALCAVWLVNSLALARIGQHKKGDLR